MVEQQRRRVEQEITKIVDEIDKSHLRKMQAEMHRCATTCCESTTLSIEGVQKCVERCSEPLANAQNYVQNEIQSTQSRLQRCVMDCNDSIKDKMGANPSENDVHKYSAMFEQCATKCVDKHVALLPTVLKAMKNVLSKGAPQS